MKKYVIAILMVLMITGSVGAWQWFPIASDSDWTVHGSYPAACTNQFIRALGDTNTCASVGIADITNTDNTGDCTSDYVCLGGHSHSTLKLTTGGEPTCNEAARGTFWYIAGAAGVKDIVEVCAKDAANSYVWRIIY